MRSCSEIDGHLALVLGLLCFRCAVVQFTLSVGQFMELKLSNNAVAVYNAIYLFGHNFVF